jgi:hypothetical protein
MWWCPELESCGTTSNNWTAECVQQYNSICTAVHDDWSPFESSFKELRVSIYRVPISQTLNWFINHKFEGMNSLAIAANWTEAVPNPPGWELRPNDFLKQIHKVAREDTYLTSKYSAWYKGASFLHSHELNCFIIFLIGGKSPWTQATQNKSNCREKPLLIEHNSANWSSNMSSFPTPIYLSSDIRCVE